MVGKSGQTGEGPEAKLIGSRTGSIAVVRRGLEHGGNCQPPASQPQNGGRASGAHQGKARPEDHAGIPALRHPLGGRARRAGCVRNSRRGNAVKIGRKAPGGFRLLTSAATIRFPFFNGGLRGFPDRISILLIGCVLPALGTRVVRPNSRRCLLAVICFHEYGKSSNRV